ncbi:hypothetical protein RTCIAT899_PB01045 (plasmid) [Rhizobium tropici CIAT 899]|nr:hypothetical protein RTCIAT899_PB01045 [Rhizobium tropici CIAT 899]
MPSDKWDSKHRDDWAARLSYVGHCRKDNVAFGFKALGHRHNPNLSTNVFRHSN